MTSDKRNAAVSCVDAIVEACDLYDAYENAKMIHYKDLPERMPEDTYTLDEFVDVSTDKVPLCMQRDEEGKLVVTAGPLSHALIIGATGSGKTQSILLNEAELLVRSELRPSIVFTDPKEEIFREIAPTCVENGYKIIKLDLCDYSVSDRWNPMTYIYRLYREYRELRSTVEDTVIGGVSYKKFRGSVYKDKKKLECAIHAVETDLMTRVDMGIEELSQIICTTPDGKKDEWREGARSIFKAIIYGMLEDSDPNDRGLAQITEDTFSFATMVNIVDSFGGRGSEYDKGYFGDRDSLDSKARRYADKYILISAENTRNGFVSTLASCMTKIRDMAIRQVTCSNTFEFEDFDDGKQPVAIFIVFKDETDAYDHFVGMFLTRLYASLIEMIRKNGGKPRQRPFFFLLDEFGNLPAFPNFDKVTSLGRGRNIWFWVVLQSYAQLNEVYGGKATTIKNNLNTHIYLGTNDLETKKSFSDECGLHTITSPIAVLNGQDAHIGQYTKETIPLIPVSKLSKLPVGECIITRMNEDVIWSRFERHYTCPEFGEDKKPYVHNSGFTPGDTRFEYDIESMIAKSKKKKSRYDFDF